MQRYRWAKRQDKLASPKTFGQSPYQRAFPPAPIYIASDTNTDTKLTQLEQHIETLTYEYNSLKDKLDANNKIKEYAHEEILNLSYMVTQMQSKIFELDDRAVFEYNDTLPENMICRGKDIPNICAILKTTDHIIQEQDDNLSVCRSS